MIRDHLLPEQRETVAIDVRDQRDPDGHVDLLAPMAGVLFGLCASVAGWLVLFVIAHVALAICRAHHP